MAAEAGRHGESPAKLVIAGGKGWYYERIFARVSELGLADEVIFPGYVPAQELPWWYRAAELFVYPSVFEGFGLPVLEAMACGTPTITSTASALAEVAGDAALLVDPADTEALAEAIGRVLGDPAHGRSAAPCRTVPGCPLSLDTDGGCDSRLVQQRARRARHDERLPALDALGDVDRGCAPDQRRLRHRVLAAL